MIADVFIRRPVTAIVVSLVITITGLLAMLNLPISQYPDITPPVVQVSGIFTGADALTVEQTVTTPVETQVNGSPGMAYIYTNSTSDGRMTMNVTFNVGTNIDIATLDVQNRVSIATPLLPDDVRRLGLTVRKRNPSILMLVAIYSPNGSHDVKFTDNYANIYIRDALLRVKGVGDIFSRADDFSMRIWIDPENLAKYSITADEVVSAIQGQNMQVAAGAIGAPPQPSSQMFEYIIKVKGRLITEEEFRNIIIRTRPDGSITYLKDIARVELGKFNYSSNSFVDGKRASYLLVYQAPGSNSLETADGVYKAMEKLKKSFPADIDYMVPFEAVSVVRVSINEVIHTLVEALVLVMIVVFLFLQSWRATLIPLLVIPVSLIGTFILFIPLGFTINTLTLFGFVLAIGIVVDDAIVVVEAVQHHIDNDHMTPTDATILAMKEISAPVIAIALILAAVFVPVGFVPGIVGRLYQQFAITIAISVLISAFLALSLTPALCSLILRPMHLDKNAHGINKIFYKFNVWFGRTSDSYSNGVRKGIRKTPLVIIILICLFVATFSLFKTKSTGFIPLEDEGRLYITFELPEASSTTRTLNVMNKMMKILKDAPGIQHFAALGGLNVVTFSSKSNNGTVFCQLKPWDERKNKALQLRSIMADLQKRFEVIKEANIIIIPPPPIPGLGSTAGFSFILQQRESNDDVKGFERVVQNYMAEANKRPEIARAFTFFSARTPGYQLEIDRVKCQKLGIPVSSVFSTIQTLMGSRYVNDFTVYGRNFRVVTQADNIFRSEIKDLDQYYVRNLNGSMTPLNSIVSYSNVEIAPLLSHFNLFRSAEFNGDAKPGFSSGDAIKALQEVADKVLPTGYGYEFSGLSREEISSGSSSIYIFMLSILFVFLFLAALYESWSVPLSVLLAVPIGAFGAILVLNLLPYLSNNVYAQIGLITLIGLSAKNAILIVEFAKERVDRGIDLTEATLEAVKLRLRPIIMTSMAFILGVLPLAFSSGAGAISRQTIGWTVFGGMLAATGLAIFTVPILFVLITKIAYGKEKLEQLKSNRNQKKT